MKRKVILEARKELMESIRSLFIHADRLDVWLMAFGFLGAVVEGLVDRIRYLFTSRMVSGIANSSTLDSHVLIENLNKNALAMLYTACLTFAAGFIEGYCWTRTGERQAARMRVAYLKALLRQELGYFDLQGTSTSDVVTSISNDSILIQDVISEKIPDLVSRVSSFIGGYLVAFLLVWQLALVALPLALVIVLPGWLGRRSFIHLSAEIRREYNKASSVAEQAVSSIRTVYAFVGEKRTLTEYSVALKECTKLGLRQGLVKGLAIGGSANIFAIWSLICYYGSRLVMYHGAHGGAVYFAGLAIILAGISLSGGLTNLRDITEACSVGQHVMMVIKRTPKIDSENTKGISLENFSAEVKFKKVYFSYPSRPEILVLKNFSLTIPEGKTIAVVGPSGSGKSTMLSLLQRFYDPHEGEILLDGISIHKLQVKWLRSQMALVSQEPSLLSTTIKENILFGKEDATMEEILETSNACDAHNFITQLPQGYDTQVGERGVQLSGGQKQRIAIARAMIRKTRILLLDEATSALDSESERLVQEAIDKVVMGRTTIVIAHRLSTIKGADTIAVMEDGHIVEIGCHQELIQEENGMYKSLVHLQQLDKQKNVEQDNCVPSSASIKDFDDTKNDYAIETIKSNKFNFPKPSPASPASTNDNLEDPKIHKPLFWRLMALCRPEWKQAILGCFSSILNGAIQPFYAVIMGTTISVFFWTNHDEIKEQIRTFSLLFLVLSVVSLLISISQHYSFAYVGEFLSKRIRERMLSKILSFEVGWFDKEGNSTGAICSRLTKDVNMVKSLMTDRISFLIEAISVVAISWAMGLVIAWRLAIMSIAAQALVIACFYVKRVLVKSMYRKATKAQLESTKVAVEAITNLRTVTAFSSQEGIIKMVEMAQEELHGESIRQAYYAGMALGCCLLIFHANWFLNFWYGGKLVAEGYISPKAAFQSLIIMLSMNRHVIEAGIMMPVIAQACEAIRSIFSMLDQDTRIEPENSEGYHLEKIEGQLELCNVDFAYPARPNVMVFKGFSLVVEAGKSVALVGKSGSGKSTVISLIERFYDPLKGAVKIDSQDIRSYNLRSLRNHISLVNQEPILFAGSIRENITYGLSNSINEAEIIEAARAVNIHDFIQMQQNGYETLCGDKGLQLSGGQKQRIAIARAMLRNPIVLLLDEATSALDSHTEKVVLEALEHIMKGRTSVVVAHRLCTIQNCDEIVVLDNGKVVEKGCHFSLMSKGPAGAYHSLVSLQTAE